VNAPRGVKLVSWNVNSLRTRLDQVLDWIEANQPDVLLMQETKLPDQEFPESEFGDLNYDVTFTGERSYNGVAIASKEPLSGVLKKLPGKDSDLEPRFLAATVEGVRVVSAYVPNGRSIGSEHYAYKLEWLGRLHELLSNGPPLATTPLLIGGDYNLAPADIDVWDPKAMEGSTHVTAPERAAFQKLLDLGLFDAFRALHPKERAFTWWDYRAGNFQKNMGLRIDHFLITKPLLDRARAISIDLTQRRGAGTSDHAPLILELDDK
jgi:exodeoxyribonuclease-3